MDLRYMKPSLQKKISGVEASVKDKSDNEIWGLEPSAQDKTKLSVLDKTD